MPTNISYQRIVRQALRQTPDGATPPELAGLTGLRIEGVYRALQAMPDAYIDRWVKGRGRGGLSAVWCVVDVPEHCPRPERIQ